MTKRVTPCPQSPRLRTEEPHRERMHRPEGRRLEAARSISRDIVKSPSYMRAAERFGAETCGSPLPDPYAEHHVRSSNRTRSSSSSNSSSGTLPAASAPGQHRRRLMWFMGMTPHANPTSTLGAQSVHMAQAALLTARRYAPLLEPHLLYLSEPDDLSAWMGRMGVSVYHRNLSIRHLLPGAYQVQPTKASFSNYGAYGRLDVPVLVDELRRAGSLSADVDHDLLLYTDFDVVFTGDPTSHLLALPPPPAYYAVPDIAGPGMNSGVMLMNISGMLRLRDPLLRYGARRHFEFSLADQTMINNYCSKERHCPPPLYLPTQFGERVILPTICPTQGLDPSFCQRPTFQTFLWHFHGGTKPHMIRCWLESITALNHSVRSVTTSEAVRAAVRSCVGNHTQVNRWNPCWLTRSARLLEFWDFWVRKVAKAKALGAESERVTATRQRDGRRRSDDR